MSSLQGIVDATFDESILPADSNPGISSSWWIVRGTRLGASDCKILALIRLDLAGVLLTRFLQILPHNSLLFTSWRD